MQDDAISRFELNAHLTKLTEAWDIESATAVVQAFCHLPIASKRVTRIVKTREDASVKGHTDEMGDINISHKETEDTTVGENEGESERVGYFKVTRKERKNFSVIEFQYYWEADISTRNPRKAPNVIYGVEYLAETLEPYALIIWEWVEKDYGRLQMIIALIREPAALLEIIKVLVTRSPGSALISALISMEGWEGVPTVLYGESQM